MQFKTYYYSVEKLSVTSLQLLQVCNWRHEALLVMVMVNFTHSGRVYFLGFALGSTGIHSLPSLHINEVKMPHISK